MNWKRVGDSQWTCEVDARFSLRADRMRDGRWSWSVLASGADAPMATGITSSHGAARQAMENFLKKKGYA